MISNLTDALVVLVVFILLMGGERDISGHIKEIGKFVGNIRKAESNFRRELARELNLEELGAGELAGVRGDMSRAFADGADPPRAPRASPQDARVRELEEEVRRLRAELEELRSRARSEDGRNVQGG